MYKITVDPSFAVVKLTAEGFFSEEELGAAAAELHAGIRSLGARVGQHVTLYDLTRLKVVSPRVLQGFGAFFTDPRHRGVWAARVALVTTSPMVAMQMERVAKQRDSLRVFDRAADAMTWLLAANRRPPLAA